MSGTILRHTLAIVARSGVGADRSLKTCSSHQA
jgi:hypothetical protein